MSLPWDKGVSLQTPPEVVTLCFIVRLRKETMQTECPLGPVGVCVHSTPSAGGVHTSQCLGDGALSLNTSQSFLCLCRQMKITCSTPLIKTLPDEPSRTHLCHLSVFCSSSVFTMAISVVSLESEFMVPRGCESQNHPHRNSPGLFQRKLPSVH